MAYTDGDSLLIRLRIAPGADLTADPDTWEWEDITQWWHVPAGITHQWGRQPGAEQAETSVLDLTLKNSDGRFTSGNVQSPYWPHIEKWRVPLAFDVDLGDGAGWRNRFSGFIRRLPVTWPGRSSRMALAPIQAVGILGRLGRGSPPALSPMRRSFAATSPLAYWPMEEGTSAGLAGSAVPGIGPLRVTGSPQFTAVDRIDWGGYDWGDTPGTTSVADLSTGVTFAARLPAEVTAATADAWTVVVSAQIPAYTDLSGDLILAEVTTVPGGTFERWRVIFSAASATQSVVAYDVDGNATTLINNEPLVRDQLWFHHNVSVWQYDASTIRVGFHWWNETSFGDYQYTADVAGTLTGIRKVAINPTRVTTPDPLPVGHVGIWGEQPMPVPQWEDQYGELRDGSLRSWHNEAAHYRLLRLGTEDHIPVVVPSVTDSTLVTRMGTQPVASRLELYHDVERTDLGVLYEQGFGLAYLPRALRYNQEPALVVDAAQRQLAGDITPVDDDQYYRDRVVASRPAGASAAAGDGEVETSADVSLASDDPLVNHATWRQRQLSWPEMRYDAIGLELHAGARALAADWCEVRPGSRIQVTNPPEQGPAGPIDQIVVGGREVYAGRRSWTATANVVPAGPWHVWVVEDPVLGRIDTTLSALAADASAADTTLLVATISPYRRWITTDERPQDLPMMASVGGVVVQVDAISGPASPQVFTLAEPLGVDLPAGVEVQISRTAVPA